MRTKSSQGSSGSSSAVGLLQASSTLLVALLVLQPPSSLLLVSGSGLLGDKSAEFTVDSSIGTGALLSSAISSITGSTLSGSSKFKAGKFNVEVTKDVNKPPPAKPTPSPKRTPPPPPIKIEIEQKQDQTATLTVPSPPPPQPPKKEEKQEKKQAVKSSTLKVSKEPGLVGSLVKNVDVNIQAGKGGKASSGSRRSLMSGGVLGFGLVKGGPQEIDLKLDGSSGLGSGKIIADAISSFAASAKLKAGGVTIEKSTAKKTEKTPPSPKPSPAKPAPPTKLEFKQTQTQKGTVTLPPPPPPAPKEADKEVGKAKSASLGVKITKDVPEVKKDVSVKVTGSKGASKSAEKKD